MTDVTDKTETSFLIIKILEKLSKSLTSTLDQLLILVNPVIKNKIIS